MTYDFIGNIKGDLKSTLLLLDNMINTICM